MNAIRFRIAGLAAIMVLTTAIPTIAEFPYQWVRDPANPISQEFPGSTVLFHDGIYKTWGDWGDDIGYATSLDGRIWVSHQANPVLVRGPGEDEIDNPAVVIRDGDYHMWYSYINEGDSRIAYATSSDGIEWTKHPGNPVMNLGEPGSLG